MTTTLTLETIAQLAGVSRSTVSRVVNNHPSVSADVRQRVKKVIEQTGYRPHAAARSLASQRSRLIGLVIPRSVQALFTDPYFPLLIQGIARACNQHDYSLSLFLFHSESEEEKLYGRVMQNGLLDGVIVTATQVGDPLIPQLLDNQVPFVVVGRPDHADRVSYVDVDNVVGAYTAVSHLLRLGRQRVATITGPLKNLAGVDRRQGYLDALNAAGRAIDEALIVEGDFTEMGGYSAMQRLLPREPDAIFAASDTMALGAIRALHDSGLSVPSDVAVIGFDDLPSSRHTIPPLTTVRQPIRRTGATAFETLLDILENGRQPPRRIILSTELVLRESCGSRPMD